MKRLIPAVFAGAIVASLIVLLMIRLIAVEEPEPNRSRVLLPLEAADHLIVNTVSEARRDPDCERAESDLSAKLVQSRSCDSDADCALAHFGCPFGSIAAVNRSTLADLYQEERAFQQQCSRCVYSVSTPLIEWRATCVRQRCIVEDRTVRDFEKETIEHINRFD